MSSTAYATPLVHPASRPSSTPQAAPFVKWVGGKSRLLSQLRPLLPPGVELMRHVEPFAGGAAFFFSQRPERALLADVNRELIETYVVVRDDVEAVIEALTPLAQAHDSERYYWRRQCFNEQRSLDAPTRAALFIYLNKTCFNGLYRVNRQGHFNVPLGRYQRPSIFDPNMLRAASEALRSAELCCEPFEFLLHKARPGDFIYFDPPYEPVSRTANFTSYSAGGFQQEDQVRLRDVFSALDRRGAKLMLSNSDVPFVRSLYDGWNTRVVAAPRAVNCDPAKRGKVTELVVRNYGA